MASVECGFSDNAGRTGHQILTSLGPTLLVNIGFDPAFVLGGPAPVPGIKDVHALVDTGAGESCIDSLLAAQLKLPLVDRRMVAGAHGAKEVNVHLAQVHVPSLDFIIYGAFSAVDLSAGGQPHLALIGRTFLRNFKMVYDGRAGSVVISSYA